MKTAFTKAATARRKVRYIHPCFDPGLKSLFFTGAIQQFGELGSSLATLVSRSLMAGPVLSTYPYLAAGHRHTHVYRRDVGQAGQELRLRIPRSGRHLDLRHSLCRVGHRAEHN